MEASTTAGVVIRVHEIFLAFLLISLACPVHAEDEAGKQEALKAANAWVAQLDRPDTDGAAEGMAEETIAIFHWPTRAANLAVMSGLLNAPPRGGIGTRKMSRTFRPEDTKQMSSCSCGIRDGEFFVFVYDVTYTWTQHQIYQTKKGSDVLWMLLEKDGTWKPVKIEFFQVSEQHGPA